MKKLLGNLIIVGPAHANIIKLRYTPKAFMSLAAVVFCTLGFVVAREYVFPRLVTDNEQSVLELENQQLKVANRDLHLKAQRIDYRIADLEAQSRRIQELIDTE